MLSPTLGEENGTRTPSAQACRFLNARIAPFAHAADSESINAALLRSLEIVRCAGGGIQSKGFNFGAPLQCTENRPLLKHRNWRHVRLGLNPCVTISTDFFGYFLSRKESDIVHQHLSTTTPRIALSHGN